MFWRRRGRPEPHERNVAAYVYRRGGRLFVSPVFDHYESGEPDVLPAGVAPAALGGVVLAALARSRAETVDRPDVQPLLRAAGVRSYGRFVTGTTSVDAREAGGAITVTLMRNLGPRGGFEWTDQTWDVPLGDPQRLGEAIHGALGREAEPSPAEDEDEPDPEVEPEEIEATLEWIVAALTSSGYRVDLSPASLREVERFFGEQLAAPGEPVADGLLAEGLGARLFGLGVYVGEVIRRAVGGEWGSGGEVDLELELADGSTVWPVRRVMARYELGDEESVVAYGAALGAR
jgi:hypothetical protein